jgi:hypothetical protein
VRLHDGKLPDLTSKAHNLNQWWHNKKTTLCHIAGHSQYHHSGTGFFNTIDPTQPFDNHGKRTSRASLPGQDNDDTIK